ncbi:helix-turn-helix domain-containing protein [Natrialbaceae archaeon GCM10025810]|uniref:helix-turn-helix domain-containing protein n=1 Tax=Halovalidus salilacus TaxID=3075124 RepID=UPI00361B4AA7
MTGFRATVAVRNPPGCPVASVSTRTDAPVSSVVRSGGPTGEGTAVEEFSVDSGVGREAQTELSGDLAVELTPVHESETENVYRFERDPGGACACEIVEQSGVPLTSIRARDGTLLLSFRTLELEAIAEIVDNLREYADGVVVEELTQTGDESTADPVLVDRSELTDRQREILETAHEMGYFSYPKGANATDVAEELGVARSTFTEHLAAAQTKLMDAILEG